MWGDYGRFLERIAVGQKVIVKEGSSQQAIVIVDRLTATQIILEDGTRFNRRTGRASGRVAYRATFLSPFTKELADQIEHRELINWVKYEDWSKQSLEVLRVLHWAYQKAITQ